MINFEEFKKLDLRVAKIIAAEKIESSDKLLKLNIDLGSEEKTIVAGISQHYSAEELIGRQIVVVANLEPRSLKGVESQGMLLAAESEDGTLALIQPDKDISSGTPVH